MAEFFLSFGFLLGLVIDVLVLFFVAGFLKVRNNSFGKAVILMIVATFLGYILGPILLVLLFASIGAFFLALIASLFIRLILIKIVYRVGLSKAFSIWVVSAIVSVVVSLLLPF